MTYPVRLYESHSIFTHAHRKTMLIRQHPVVDKPQPKFKLLIYCFPLRLNKCHPLSLSLLSMSMMRRGCSQPKGFLFLSTDAVVFSPSLSASSTSHAQNAHRISDALTASGHDLKVFCSRFSGSAMIKYTRGTDDDALFGINKNIILRKPIIPLYNQRAAAENGFDYALRSASRRDVLFSGKLIMFHWSRKGPPGGVWHHQ